VNAWQFPEEAIVGNKQPDAGPARLAPGTIAWADLTVADADRVRDFYRGVVGWVTSELDMGGYSDYGMHTPVDRTLVAGICHARRSNAELPPYWLIYITVANLDEAMARCREKRGRVYAGPLSAGSLGRFCVIQDPAGALAALLEPPPPGPKHRNGG
jgi:predicted enzyme related to lactoylglutathione lyase